MFDDGVEDLFGGGGTMGSFPAGGGGTMTSVVGVPSFVGMVSVVGGGG